MDSAAEEHVSSEPITDCIADDFLRNQKARK